MKEIVCTVLIGMNFPPCFAQLVVRSISTNFFNIATHEWQDNKPETVKRKMVQTDSTFYYPKEHAVEGSLVMVQNFDSLGNVTESDEFTRGNKGNIWRITSYSYLDKELYKKEIVTQLKEWRSNTFRYEKDILTYEYDSTGKRISVKSFHYPDESLKDYILMTFTYEYDSTGRIARILKHPQGKNEHLDRLFKYEDSVLVGINEYDSNGILMYTLISRFDSKKNIKSFYKNEESPDFLASRLNFDEKGRLIKEEYFSDEEVKLITRTFSYTADDLIEKQNELYTNHMGDSYFRHFYSIR